MEKSKLKKGIQVTISNNISKTDASYGTNSIMRGMKGKTYKIDGVRTNSRGKVSALINEYTWNPDDLTEVSIERKPEPFHFNVKELNV